MQAAEAFQTNLLKTMMQIEKSFFDLAEESTKPQNILVICDRGAMDASAYIAREQWDRILEATGNVSPEKYKGGHNYYFLPQTGRLMSRTGCRNESAPDEI